MVISIRAKRVTDPLDDKMRARLCGGFSSSSSGSGSDHDAACLSGLVNDFLESDDAASHAAASVSTTAVAADGGGDDSGDDGGDHVANAVETLRDLLDPKGDLFRIRLLAASSAAAASAAQSGRTAFLRAVMGRLREAGYNAGLCKARWQSNGGLTAGSYEYVDVVTSEARYIVELDFAAGFEVARATAEHVAVAAALPRVAVATAEEVRRVVRVMAEAARRSLRTRGMSVPPWRKSRYMLAMWLGPYRRTTNPLPSTSAVDSRGDEVPSRAVGFWAVPAAALVPPAARTRIAERVRSNLIPVCGA